MIGSMDALNQAVEAAGGVGKLAAGIGVAQNVVSNWKARGQVPADRCPAIESMTGIACEKVRPDLGWHRVNGKVTGYHVPLGEAA